MPALPVTESRMLDAALNQNGAAKFTGRDGDPAKAKLFNPLLSPPLLPVLVNSETNHTHENKPVVNPCA